MMDLETFVKKELRNLLNEANKGARQIRERISTINRELRACPERTTYDAEVWYKRKNEKEGNETYLSVMHKGSIEDALKKAAIKFKAMNRKAHGVHEFTEFTVYVNIPADVLNIEVPERFYKKYLKGLNL